MGALNHDGRVDHQTKLQNIPKKCTTPTMLQKEIGILLASQPRKTPKQGGYGMMPFGIGNSRMFQSSIQLEVQPLILKPLRLLSSTGISIWHYLSFDQNLHHKNVQHCSATFVGKLLKKNNHRSTAQTATHMLITSQAPSQAPSNQASQMKLRSE